MTDGSFRILPGAGGVNEAGGGRVNTGSGKVRLFHGRANQESDS